MKPRYILISAIILTFLLGMVPFIGWLLLYPFELFGTFIHESWHAIAAVLTGGQSKGMHINWDTSGLAYSSGGIRPIVASAGYLGSTLTGGILLLVARHERLAQPALVIAGALTLLSTIFFGGYGNPILSLIGAGVGTSLFAASFGKEDRIAGALKWSGGIVLLGLILYLAVTGSLLTWSVGLFMGLALVAMGGLTSPKVAQGFLIFFGVQCSLDAVVGIKHLFFITDRHTDAATLAELSGLPAFFWAFAWLSVSVVALGAIVALYWRDDRRAIPSRSSF